MSNLDIHVLFFKIHNYISVCIHIITDILTDIYVEMSDKLESVKFGYPCFIFLST